MRLPNTQKEPSSEVLLQLKTNALATHVHKRKKPSKKT
jgi:hypothetical protein